MSDAIDEELERRRYRPPLPPGWNQMEGHPRTKRWMVVLFWEYGEYVPRIVKWRRAKDGFDWLDQRGFGHRGGHGWVDLPPCAVRS